MYGRNCSCCCLIFSKSLLFQLIRSVCMFAFAHVFVCVCLCVLQVTCPRSCCSVSGWTARVSVRKGQFAMKCCRPWSSKGSHNSATSWSHSQTCLWGRLHFGDLFYLSGPLFGGPLTFWTAYLPGPLSFGDSFSLWGPLT